MKKAKIMFMAIAVFGVIGGALAFKSFKFFGGTKAICTTTAVGGPLVCVIGYSTLGEPRLATTLWNTTKVAPAQFACENTIVAVPYYCTTLITTYAVANLGE